MSEDAAFRIAYITAGAGGMFCGSCMHDNTLARALSRQPGVECLLVPTYTPIRTDEEDVSIKQVFFGGLTVYLEQKIPLFRYAPGFLTRALDQPWLIRWVAARAVGTDPQQLGGLTVSMLRGAAGYQRRDVRRLCRWLQEHARPHVINLSNMLIGGCIPELKRALRIPVFVTLQGDDIFLDSLAEPHRSQAVAEIRRLVPQVDGFLVNSRFYAEEMARRFAIPDDKLHLVPLCLDLRDFSPTAVPQPAADRPPTIGYLARLAPEKGLHQLVDAFLELRKFPEMSTARLEIAGWLGAHRQTYADEQFHRLREAGLGEHFRYWGSVDRAGKLDFLSRLDLLSVPTTYHEPKGLFVLESLAAGVPVVQPDHGAFPELIAATGGGELVPPNAPAQLAQTWRRLLLDAPARRALAAQGQATVRTQFGADQIAQRVLELWKQAPGPR